ncbi:MAG TPA: hypothetical protein VGO62_07220, partial [Myxococcota bacterium]
MPVSNAAATPKDAAFLNKIVADLHKPALAPEVSEKIKETVGDIPVQGFVTDKMVTEAWERRASSKASGPAFARFRAELFFSLLARAGYNLDESKVKGDAASSLRLLASNTPALVSHGDYFNKALGGAVTDVDVSITNQRIYLRTDDANRGDYLPGRGLAVINKSADGYALALPGRTAIPLTKQIDPDLLTSTEKRDYAAARGAVADVIKQYLGLPGPTDMIVRRHANREDLDPATQQFARALLSGIDAVDGKTTQITATSLDKPAAKPSDLNQNAIRVIHAFKNGELNFLTGQYATDLDTRARGKQMASDAVDQLVGFVVDNKASARWGLDKLAGAPDAVTRASWMVNGFSHAFDNLSEMNALHWKKSPVTASDSVPGSVRG